MRRTKIRVGREAHDLLVAETVAERVHGMNSGAPRPYSGMVFHFDPKSIATMTMERTTLPLQIAFVGPNRIVHTVYDAPPLSGTYSSPLPTRWVIETMWNVLNTGDRVDFVR